MLPYTNLPTGGRLNPAAAAAQATINAPWVLPNAAATPAKPAATQTLGLVTQMPLTPQATPAPTSITVPAGGLLGAARSQLAPTIARAPSTYTPTGYNAYNATTASYAPVSGNATTYGPTKVDQTGTTYVPTTQTVDPNELTSTQLNALTSGNSAYIQNARRQGLAQAARSGLMTSSIAAGNAQAAAIAAAEPIAQADAGQYAAVASQNMAAENTAGQFNAGTTLNVATTNATAANSAGQFNANAENQMTGTNLAAQNEANQFNANAANTTGQFNANSSNQAAAYSANAANEAAQANATQTNAANQFNATQANGVGEADQALMAQQTNNYLTWEDQREQEMGQVLSSIYNNPNLTPDQQNEAASNAKTIYTGLWTATNNTFANGVPQIFTNV